MEQVLLETITSQKKQATRKIQHRLMKSKSCLTNLITFWNKITSSNQMGWAVDTASLDISKKVNIIFNSPLLDKLARYRLDGCLQDGVWNWLIGCTQRWQLVFLLMLAACHKQDPPGISTGPHTVQHLHKWSGCWDWQHPHHVCWWH